MQIDFHKHWRAMLPGQSRLGVQRRRVFASALCRFTSNESIGVAIAIMNIIWTPVVFLSIAVPDKILTLPILFMLGVSLAHFVLLYRRCVGMSAKDMALALTAHMSLQWTIARAVGSSCASSSSSAQTRARAGREFPARAEAILAGLLLASALTVYLTNYTEVRDLDLLAAGDGGAEPAVPVRCRACPASADAAPVLDADEDRRRPARSPSSRSCGFLRPSRLPASRWRIRCRLRHG